jgi:hypothetical protein
MAMDVGGGLVLTLRPTWEALVAIEAAAGVSLIVLAQEAIGRRLGLKAMTDIVAAGAAAGGDVVPSDLGARLLAKGILSLCLPMAEFLTGAIQPADAGNGVAGVGNTTSAT